MDELSREYPPDWPERQAADRAAMETTGEAGEEAAAEEEIADEANGEYEVEAILDVRVLVHVSPPFSSTYLVFS